MFQTPFTCWFQSPSVSFLFPTSWRSCPTTGLSKASKAPYLTVLAESSSSVGLWQTLSSQALWSGHHTFLSSVLVPSVVPYPSSIVLKPLTAIGNNNDSYEPVCQGLIPFVRPQAPKLMSQQQACGCVAWFLDFCSTQTKPVCLHIHNLRI